MPIVVQPGKSSRVRALAEAEPQLTRTEIARRLGLLKSEVDDALGRRPHRRIRSTAQ